MYIPDHLKWRVLTARTLKSLYFESENSNRTCKRIFEVFARYLLGTTYDTFLSYLNEKKYNTSDLKLPSFIVTALGLLDGIRITCEHLHARRPNTAWTPVEIVEELLAVVRRKAEGKPSRRIHVD